MATKAAEVTTPPVSALKQGELPGVDPKPAAPAADAPAADAPAAAAAPVVDEQYFGKYISTCYGVMVNPHSGVRYDRPPQPITEMDGWVQSQIEEKKMEVVDAPEAEAPAAE